MKNFRTCLFGTMLLLAFSCDDQSTAPNHEYFEVNVIGPGIDCGETYLVEFKTNLEEVYGIVGNKTSNIFYADSLGSEFKQEGKQILISFRNPREEEIHPCTALGPSYQHIVVRDAKDK